jgi:CTP:molybdopterin cytidylyltransferase MocA
MNNTGILILAAGGSSRFGTAKQLVRYNNKTLLQHVIDEAVLSGAEPVIVVTGSDADKISQNIRSEKVQIALNDHWQQGMAGSIVAGMKAAIAYNKIDQVIITVSDQPFVSSSLFEKLYQTQSESGQPIVACAYADTIGTPVLFTKRYFDVLLGLQGEQGAKKILQSNSQHTAVVDFPEGYIDIDTEADFKTLTDKQKPVS